MQLRTDYTLAIENPSLHNPIGVLDLGEVQLIDWNGSDQRIVDAARVSYQAGTKQVRKDEALIDYLMRHNHTSPFEMNSITFRMKMPIYVARQWLRQRTASLNEQSGRYSVMVDEFNLPQELRVQSTTNKQTSSGRMEEEQERELIASMKETYDTCYAEYQKLLEAGVPREQARMVLPAALYTSFYWQLDLHNLTKLLNERLSDKAQAETRAYAQVVAYFVATLFPVTWAAFSEHRLNAVTFSHTEITLMRALYAALPEAAEFLKNAAESEGMRPTRVKEFLEKVFGA